MLSDEQTLAMVHDAHYTEDVTLVTDTAGVADKYVELLKATGLTASKVMIFLLR